MEDVKCKTLLEKLDLEILRLQSFSPENEVITPTEVPPLVGFKITNKTKVEDIPEDKIPLVHSLLHLFYHNKSGANLSLKNIEQLHKDISQKMKNHKTFDNLDE